MIEKILNNWFWKLLSVVIAFVFWVVIVNYQDPIITEDYENIPVEKRNEIAITSKNQAVDYLEGETVNISLRGKRSVIDNLDPENINVYADLGKVSITNAIDIIVDMNDQIEVVEMSPNNMVISMEPINTILKRVQIFFEGEIAKDYVKLKELVTPNQIEITGPASKLAMVSSIVVPVDVDEASGDVTAFVAPQLLDSEGNDVSGIVTSHDQIQIKVPIQKIKTVPVLYATKGVINENYSLEFISLQKDGITVRGEEEDLENFSRLLINDVDLSTLTDQVTSLQINLSDYLPEGIVIYEDVLTTEILVDVQPIIPQIFQVEQADINVRQLPDGLQFKFVDEEEVYSVGLEGIYKELSKISTSDLLPSISLKDLEVGIHEIEMTLIITDDFELITDIPIVKIELVESEEVPETEESTETTTE